MNISGVSRLMFNQMDRFQHWDVAWAHIIGLSSLTTLKLTPFWPMVKEFL
jgi:hypothetical protein